jgi:hypothetical protein
VTRKSTDQLTLYDGLTPRFDRVSAADLRRYFRSSRRSSAPNSCRPWSDVSGPRPGSASGTTSGSRTTPRRRPRSTERSRYGAAPATKQGNAVVDDAASSPRRPARPRPSQRACPPATRSSSPRAAPRRDTRSSSQGRRSATTTRGSCSSSTSTAAGSMPEGPRSPASRSTSCWGAARTTRGTRPPGALDPQARDAERAREGIDPKEGVIVNWNNKPGHGFAAADDQWNYGPVQRVDLLRQALSARRMHWRMRS